MRGKSLFKKILATGLAVSMIMSGILINVDNSAKVKAAETTDTSKSVLDVKVQVSTDNTVMRFISSVDSLDYSAVGFEVTPEGQEKPIPYETTTVFKRIESTSEKVKYEFSPKVVDTASEYFVTAKMYVEAGTDYTVRAYVVSLDGQTKIYGMSRCVAVEDAATGDNSQLNLSFASTANVTTETADLSVTYGADNQTTAEIVGSDGNAVWVRVNVDKAKLDSATLFTFTGAASGSTIYRNLYTEYNGSNADTTWYSVYAAANKTEFVIATDADMYGFASVVEKTDQLLDKTVYLVSDLSLNDGRPVLASDNFVTWVYDELVDVNKDGVEDRTPYNWNPIGTNNTAPFKGTFDGQGHTIAGMYCIDEDQVAGLFEHANNNSVIGNVKLVDSYVYETMNYAGSIAGKSSGILHDIYTDAIVKTNQSQASSITGGIVGTYEPDSTASDTHTISRCWFDGAVISIGHYNGGIIGYLCAGTANATITLEDCLVAGVVKGYSHSGGIIGMSPDRGKYTTLTINMNRCLSAGTYTTSKSNACGALIGGIQNMATNMTSSYATDDCGTNFTKLFGEQGTSATVDVTATASTNIFARTTISGLNAKKYLGLDGDSTAWTLTNNVPELKQFAKYEFDLDWYNDNPSATEFTISTAAELYALGAISQTTNFAGKTIKLANDIVLNEGDADEWANGHLVGLKRWSSIGSNASATQFKGTFDGQGHTISGIYGSYTTICQGLFATVGSGGVVKDLRVVNSFLTSTTGYLGSVVGRSDRGTFSKIYSDAHVVGTGALKSGTSVNINNGYIAGIAGVAIAPIDGTDDVLFSECWFNGTVNSTTARNGGIVGNVEGDAANGTETVWIQDCLFTGSVTTSANYHTYCYGTGGILGTTAGKQANIAFKNCIAVDDVAITSGNHFLGAIMGCTLTSTSTNVSVDNCFVVGSDVPPIGSAAHANFKGTVNGSATVVDSISDAAAMATASSVWTLVGGTPVLTVFKDIQP